MLCMVSVKDKRTRDGYGTRSKSFDNLQQCDEWAATLKNRVMNNYDVLDGGICRRYKIGDNKESSIDMCDLMCN